MGDTPVGTEDWPGSRPMILGIAGGSGSGKTTIAEALIDAIGPDVVLIEHDAYYRDLSDLPLERRAAANFDHPDSLETALLVRHLELLLEGSPIEKPRYDFSRYVRLAETVTVHSAPVILVEGILVLAEAPLRALMDLKIFVDTDPDLRLARRLRRDLEERGRSPASVLEQYEATVRPMHLQFVEPSKRYADIIIPEGYNTGAVGTVIGMIRQFLRR